MEERGGEKARVEAAERAEEGGAGGGGGQGAARGEAPQEDGALVGQGGDTVRRRLRRWRHIGLFGSRSSRACLELRASQAHMDRLRTCNTYVFG
jgi:hypothetical protein